MGETDVKKRTGWVVARIGDVGEVRLGRQRSPKNRSSKHPTKYVRAANLTWAGFDLSDMLDMEFSPKELQTYRLMPGDVLLSEASGSAGEVGKPAVWNGEIDNCCFQNTVVRFRSHGAVTPKFAYMVFSHFARNGIFARVSKGVGIHHLSADRFADMDFPVPPLAEQDRIVAKIEELFSELDAGVAALERVRANLKRYRASVLNAAVNGKLTDPSTMFPLAPIGELITGMGQGWSPRCDLTRVTGDDEWGIITTTAVQPMLYDDAQSKPLPAALAPRPSIEIKVGDMLMTRKGPRWRAGVACLVRQTRSRLMVCDTVYRFRCVAEKADPAFLELVLNAPSVTAEINRKKAGINESGVSLTHQKVCEILVPLPSLHEQAAIVSEVERRLSVMTAVQTEIEHGLQRAIRLRQAILKRGFEGKLVPQDPNDEPAASQLERHSSALTASGRVQSQKATSKRRSSSKKTIAGEK